MTTWTDDKEQELFEAQETIAELLEALEGTLEALQCWEVECPQSWDNGDVDAVAVAEGVIRKTKEQI